MNYKEINIFLTSSKWETFLEIEKGLSNALKLPTQQIKQIIAWNVAARGASVARGLGNVGHAGFFIINWSKYVLRA